MRARPRKDATLRTRRLLLAAPTARDAEPFLAAAKRSRKLHAGWVVPPQTRSAFNAYRRRVGSAQGLGFLARDRESHELVGVVNVNEIVRGSFQSGTLGYYAFSPHAGRGLMHEALGAVVRAAFRQHRLHRLEANIQPQNVASLALVRSLGFEREGYSPRYLKVAGRWRDHERWAICRDAD